MKKIIALLLSIICIFSAVSVSAYAEDEIEGIVGDVIGGILDVEVTEDEPLVYGVFYEMETLSNISIMYKPNPSISFNKSGTYTITSDTPLSVDYQFVCWEHSETGKLYYAGDKLYVDGKETLYAVWEEKTDNDIRIVRVLKTSIEALRRLLGKFLGMYEDFIEFEEEYFNPTQPEAPSTVIVLSDSTAVVDYKYEENNRFFKIYILNDEFGEISSNLVHSTISFGGKSYPVEMSVTNETETFEGKECQFIRVAFVDGVPSPERGIRLTYNIPEYFLKDADKKANAAFTSSFLTTNYV